MNISSCTLTAQDIKGPCVQTRHSTGKILVLGQNPGFGANPTSGTCLSPAPSLGKTLASLLRLLGRVCVSADGFEGVL